MAVFSEKEHVHQQEWAEVDDEDHEGRVEVVELRGEQDAVHAPKHGGEGHSQRPDEFCILLVVFMSFVFCWLSFILISYYGLKTLKTGLPRHADGVSKPRM